MAEIDTSIYANINKPDPIGQIQKWSDLGQSIAQNRLKQIELGGTEALGGAALDALNPDGTVDQNKLVDSLRRNPRGWMGATAGAPMALDLQAKNLANDQAALGVNESNMKNLGTAWGTLVTGAGGKPVTKQQLYDKAVDLFAQGLITRDFLKSTLGNLRGVKDEDVSKYATGGFMQSLPQGTLATDAPAAPGPEGQPRQQTRGQFISDSLGTEPSGGVTTGLSPAESAASTSTGTAMAGLANTLVEQANNVPDRMAALENLEADAEEFTTGPQSERIKEIVATINQFFGTDFKSEELAAQDRFNKVASTLALNQASLMNATDQTTRVAMGANPNVTMTNLGIKGVIAMLKGNEDAIALKARMWQESGLPGNKFGKWSADFNKNFDPRVFQSVYLSQDERTKMVKGMSKEQREKFKQRYNAAVKAGWIPRPLSITVTKPAGAE